MFSFAFVCLCRYKFVKSKEKKMDSDRFDIENLHKNFTAALKDETDVMMDFYLEGFKELYKYGFN